MNVDPRKCAFCTVLTHDSLLAGVQVLAYSIHAAINKEQGEKVREKKTEQLNSDLDDLQ